MTDKEKSRKIAEFLGYRHDTSDSEFDQWHDPACKCASSKPEDICTCLPGCYIAVGTPPDMFHDPAMTLMLLEKLMVDRGFVSLSAWISSPMRVCITGQVINGQWKSDEPSTYAASEILGEAVADAFIKANNL